MSRRRACLVVPAAPAAKLAKGATLAADEVVLDLEDAVVPAAQGRGARRGGGRARRRWAAESVAVRVNAIGSPWCHSDLAALAASGRDVVTAVLPKVEHAARPRLRRPAARGRGGRGGPDDPGAAGRADRDGGGPGGRGGDRARVGAAGRARARLRRSRRLARPAGARRAGGLALRAGERARRGARGGHPGDRRAAPRHARRRRLPRRRAHARALGYDGKWAIHPAQLDTLRETFTPTDEEVADAREVLAALERAAADGAGAVAAGDQMLDEALALSARRVLARAGAER